MPARKKRKLGEREESQEDEEQVMRQDQLGVYSFFAVVEYLLVIDLESWKAIYINWYFENWRQHTKFTVYVVKASTGTEIFSQLMYTNGMLNIWSNFREKKLAYMIKG